MKLADLAIRTYNDTFAAQNRPEDMRVYLASVYGEELQRAELIDPAMITLVVEEGDAMIAFAQLKQSDADSVEIWRFYVDRGRHGRGVAQQLMRDVEETSRNLGARHLWLGVWEHNPRAIAFYEKCGFRKTGSKPFLVGSDLQTDNVMRREL
ncbi:MAG: GNAT family N-acetyltransferase [Thermoanaerobaculia bacterium]|nr:GNAT family N-acetyltransferase [Thermoanaerobaculia bacterium]